MTSTRAPIRIAGETTAAADAFSDKTPADARLTAPLRKAYVVALLLIAALSCASFAMLDLMIARQGDAGTTINIAGRQRMLSQRVTGLGQALARNIADGDALPERMTLRNDYANALRQLGRAHVDLVYGNRATGLSGIADEGERALYFAKPHDVDAKLRRFIATGYDLLNANTRFEALRESGKLSRLGYGDLLISLDTVVGYMETRSHAQVASARHLHFAILIATLLALLAEGLFIFRPMERGLRRNMDRVRRSRAVLAHAARHDPLTNIGNRKLLAETIDAVEAGDEIAQRAVIVVDLDRFKQVNDRHGHGKGDDLLVQLSTAMQRILREGDRVFRFGGDEFILLLALQNDLDEARRICTRVGMAVRAIVESDPAFNRVTASFGIAHWHDGKPFSEALKEADLALYESKLRGRDRATVFAQSMELAARERTRTEHLIHHALEQDRFEPFFQPQFDMRGGQVIGMEVLARMHCPDTGKMLAPDRFLRVAEQSGQIVPLGKQVIAKAVRHAMGWRGRSATVPRLSINASAQQILDHDFLPFLTSLFDTSGYPAAMLTVEVLESVVFDGQDTGIVQAVQKLRALGITIELDDFGMGHTSISNVTMLGADRIKIDRSFVARAVEDDNSRHVLRAMIAMADAMGIEVLAEGIETAMQQKLLVGMGCIYGQGFHFARPMAAAAMDGWLNSHADLTTPSGEAPSVESEDMQADPLRLRSA